jgi:hypothetical protein
LETKCNEDCDVGAMWSTNARNEECIQMNSREMWREVAHGIRRGRC